LIVVRLVLGEFSTCCYLLGGETSNEVSSYKEAIVIDPVEEGLRIVRALEERKWRAKYILNSHGHIDHIAGKAEIKKAFPEATLAIGKNDALLLRRPLKNLSIFLGRWVKSPPPDRLLVEGDTVEAGGILLKVIELPGHTPGGIGFFREGADEEPPVLFAGDTLFAGGVGRTDFPGGSEEQLIASIRNKILTLPEETIIYPGHGPETRVAEEKKNNPFLAGK